VRYRTAPRATDQHSTRSCNSRKGTAQALAHHAVFARGWREYVAERGRLQYFPAMAAKMPELRRAFFYHRLFSSPRSARLDSCLAGGALALALGSPLPLALAVPYLRLLRRHAYRVPAAGRAPGSLDVVLGRS